MSHAVSDPPDADAPARPSARRSRRSWFLLGLAIGLNVQVVAATVWVLGFRTPGYFVTNRVDITEVDAGVHQVLTDAVTGYGATNVKDVVCNDGENPAPTKGDRITCELTIHGVPRHVVVRFLDDSGTYEVGRPQ
ncbi:DUF4333 domain-containing protein [Mycolicibacillus parakoreensis]|uniref:DUF4333 domain-containing protein n=1 Tax=Mycolicibacillus parakoreensis TaxID=1069221 RepID=A0ABY3TXM8_9MYCO|nr:DUF4333 domain-containing protein [Mycolicibacillus parakoreensis]MCV7315935.1 DUF4333 domain-containing protein [Mycolicibacillus parakoreensis]ULN52433.1 DUF4333 domain-containing protein [Mycolicibacillus parakoreensis]HLR99664.1 DUF4333 domain-containing protein [Mycolicibacillus parakoreensis]